MVAEDRSVPGPGTAGRVSGMSGRTHLWIAALLLALGCLVAASRAGADGLPQPSDEVLLTVKGSVSNTNVSGEARFDRKMLEALGTKTLVTGTPWHRKGTVFEGVPADRLMEAVGAQGSTAWAIAANDYRIQIPLSDFTNFDVILAMRINRKELTLRTKGPIWLVYPDSVDLPKGERAERMIWQLVELRIE